MVYLAKHARIHYICPLTLKPYKMKHLGISGGGTKIGGLFGAAETIIKEKNYQPDIISGISAGAILSVPLALGKFDAIKKMVLDFNLDTFFNVSPIKPSGKINTWNAIKKLLGGKHYLGEQYNLEKALSELVSNEDFEKYKKDKNFAICIVGTVDFYTGKRYYVNLKEVAYEHFLKFVNASASLPIFTPGIFVDFPFKDFEGNSPSFNKVLLFDGGVRDHSPTHKILSSNVFKITETCTLFSRADKLSDMLDPKSFDPKNILKILEKYVDITNIEVSKNDEYQEHRDVKDKKIIDHGIYFLPRVMESVYDVDKPKLKKLYESARTTVSGSWDKVSTHMK